MIQITIKIILYCIMSGQKRPRAPDDSDPRGPAKKIETLHSAIDGISDALVCFKDVLSNIDMSIFPPEPEPICLDSHLCLHDHFDATVDMSKFGNGNQITVDSLIQLGLTYHCMYRTKYLGIDLKMLRRMAYPLLELNKMIGMKGIKKAVVDHIINALQVMRDDNMCGECAYCMADVGTRCEAQEKEMSEMMHTVITGPPGVGKTELGKLLGRIYTSMGLLSKGTFNIAKRSDLVGGYLGQTALKTQAFIDKCEGGVMFIDEAYSLGNAQGRDSYSKECLDTINQNLDQKRDMVCIIAGYKDDLDKCFFATNQGLARRFSFKYDIPGYSAEELKDIFMLKLSRNGWKVDDNINIMAFFEKNKKSFPHFGGDIETFFFACRIAHNRHGFLNADREYGVFTQKDLDVAFKAFSHNREDKSKISSEILHSMYI
jgi:ATPase family protein associated with various cellular activities (AAA)